MSVGDYIGRASAGSIPVVRTMKIQCFFLDFT